MKILFIVILLYTTFIRLQDLGYQEYQGDEILTLDFTERHTNESFPQYLLRQDKGPLQFIVNKTTYSLTGSMDEAVIRLPYCLAGIAFVVAIFFLARELLGNNWGALLTMSLAATNGLFISFSRITQYQAFVQLLVALTIWMLIKNKRVLAGLLFGLAFLFHYDALVALAFICFYLGKRFIQTENKKESAKEILEFFAPFVLVSSLFYLPFIFKPNVNSTSNYLAERVWGSGLIPRTIYTIKLMKFYIPVEVQYTLMVLSCIPVYFCLEPLKKLGIVLQRRTIPNFIRYTAPVAFIATFALSATWFKPRATTLLFYLLTITTLTTLFFNKKRRDAKSCVSTTLLGPSLFAWFLAGAGFYLFLHKTPRTHVYALLIPMFILASWATISLWSLVTRHWSQIFTKGCELLGVGYLLTISAIYNYKIFVEKTPEYLWGNKTVWGREMIHLEKDIYSKVDGVFGFPQNRSWKEVAGLFEQKCLVGSYSTNEKARIPEFYLRKTPVEDNADNLILVESPVSWKYRDLEREQLGYTRLKTFNIGAHPVTVIYGRNELYPEDKLLCESF